MTERERWTVYPLLLLALGVALRSKVTQSLDLHEIDCRTLTCDQLLVKGPDNKTGISLSVLPSGAGGGGQLLLHTADGKPTILLRGAPHGGVIEAAGTNGMPQAVLQATSAGGVIETLSGGGTRQTIMQSTATGGVVTTVDHENKFTVQFGAGLEHRRQTPRRLPSVQQDNDADAEECPSEPDTASNPRPAPNPRQGADDPNERPAAPAQPENESGERSDPNSGSPQLP